MAMTITAFMTENGSEQFTHVGGFCVNGDLLRYHPSRDGWSLDYADGSHEADFDAVAQFMQRHIKTTSALMDVCEQVGTPPWPYAGEDVDILGDYVVLTSDDGARIKKLLSKYRVRTYAFSTFGLSECCVSRVIFRQPKGFKIQ